APRFCHFLQLLTMLWRRAQGHLSTLSGMLQIFFNLFHENPPLKAQPQTRRNYKGSGWDPRAALFADIHIAGLGARRRLCRTTSAVVRMVTAKRQPPCIRRNLSPMFMS